MSSPFQILETELTKNITAAITADVDNKLNERGLASTKYTEDAILAMRLEFSTHLEELKRNLSNTGGSREITIIREVENNIIRDNIGHTHSKFDEVLSFLTVKLWPVLVGPTGSTKTFVTGQLARAMGVKHHVVKKLCRATAPHELLGYMTAQGTYVKGAISDIVTEGGLFVADEMDAANENVLLLLKSMRDKYITMPYGQQEVHPDCLVIATMNTWGQGATREYVGRLAQDAAVLNEFVSLEWSYDAALEEAISNDEFTRWGGNDMVGLQKFRDLFWKLRAAAEEKKVRIVFGTRNLKHCAAMLTRGYSYEYVLRACCLHGARPEDIARLKEHVDVPESIWEQKLIKILTEQPTPQPTPTPPVQIPVQTPPTDDDDEELRKLKASLRKANSEERMEPGAQTPVE